VICAMLAHAFDFVASRDDVENGKLDPEVYHLVAAEFEMSPRQCLLLEDSPSGVKAALAADMWCIAVVTPFTRESLHAQKLLEKRWIVDEPATLPAVVEQMMAAQNEAPT